MPDEQHPGEDPARGESAAASEDSDSTTPPAAEEPSLGASALPTQTGGEADSPDVVPAIPATIGRYKILRKLGEGGMGVVYEAEQESPRRKVAVKVVRGGQFVDEHLVRLFRREAETLARLKHPNIGAIYESGSTEDGQHFFAMELVQGETLDRYLKKRGTETTAEDLRFRLALFRKIADAVHYAHQRGVIHRDLKPSNIVVTEETTREESGASTGGNLSGLRLPEVKILDFGLARITEGDVTAATMTTEVGVIKGTLPYMSPEQARGKPEEIDVRTDVYALGVILYEMLSGQRPYDVLQKALVEAVRVICEEPPRPLRQTLSGVRRVDPDVETIVGKALEKEAVRRYASAAALSEDVARYLTSQPIMARPPSTVYQLRKFAARNRALVGGVAATILVLVAGIIVSTVFGLRAVRERDEASWQSYVANVAAANASLQSGGTIAARRRLSRCPPELRGWEWGHLWSRTDLSVATLAGHEGGVLSVAFSSDGTRLASGSWDKTVRVWDTATGDLLTTLTGHEGRVNSVAFSPDGARLASGSGDKTVRLWDTGTNSLLATLSGHEGPVSAVAFSLDGMRLASGSGDRTVRLWDTSSGEMLAVIGKRESGVTSVAFSPDGLRLASGSWDKTVRVWDTATGDFLTTLTGHEGMVNSVAFSPDGARLASGSGDKTVRVWNVASGDLVATLTGHDHIVTSVAFGLGGALLASASVDRTVRLWDARTAVPLATLVGHQDSVISVAFSPDGMRLASASDSGFMNELVPGKIRLWNTASGELPATISEHDRSVRSVAFSPDGTRLASAAMEDGVRLWDSASGELLATLVEGRGPIAFSPDGTRLATCSSAGYFLLWDVPSGTLLVTFARLENDNQGGAVAFSPDGTRLAASGLFQSTRSVDYSFLDQTVRVWDTKTGEPLATLVGHDGTVSSLAFSPDGKRLASGSSDKTVLVWDATTGESLLTLAGHEASVGPLIYSPDGTRLASGSLKTIRFWDVATGELLATLVGHESPVGSLAFSPDGARLASGSGEVRIWDAASGELLATLLGGRGPVAFSPDGTRLVSSSSNNTVRMWDGVASRWAATDATNKRASNVAFWGRFLNEHRQYDTAEPLLREALEIQLRAFESDDWRVADSKSRLGESLAGQGKLSEADSLLVESLDALLSDRDSSLESICRALRRVVDVESARSEHYAQASQSPVRSVVLRFSGERGSFGERSPASLLLACSSDDRDWVKDALVFAREAVESTANPNLEALEILAEAYRRNDEWDVALVTQRQALSRASDSTPLAATRVEQGLFALEARVVVGTHTGQPELAVEALRDGLEARRRYLGDDHRATLAARHDLGSLLSRQGKMTEAETYFREALEGRRRVLGPEALGTLGTLFWLTGLYRSQGRHEEAAPLYKELLEMRRRTLPEQHSSIVLALVLMGTNLNVLERYAESEPLLRECLEIRRETLDPGDWRIASTISVLGESLLGQGRYEEAEPLLIEGYESMNPPPNLMIRKTEALERVVQLYEAWGKPDKAAEWRAKREPVKPTTDSERR